MWVVELVGSGGMQDLFGLWEGETMTNSEALEWLVEWGTVIVNYDYVEYKPHYRHGESLRIDADYGPDELPRLCDQVRMFKEG